MGGVRPYARENRQISPSSNVRAAGGLTCNARTQSAGCPLRKLGSRLGSAEANPPAVSVL
jgi:hypothetical protein